MYETHETQCNVKVFEYIYIYIERERERSWKESSTNLVLALKFLWALKFFFPSNV